jgi:hypothetical protein
MVLSFDHPSAAARMGAKLRSPIRRSEDGSVVGARREHAPPNIPEQVQQFAPKEKPPPAPKEGPPRSDGDVLDEVGQAILGLLCDRAMGAADKLSIRLRDAEDRKSVWAGW